jgi:hypothetical protein
MTYGTLSFMSTSLHVGSYFHSSNNIKTVANLTLKAKLKMPSN